MRSSLLQSPDRLCLNILSSKIIFHPVSQDEKNQLLTTCMWFNLVWDDYQLSWNETEYGGVDSVVIQPRNLWIPDILLYNRSVLSKVVSGKTIVQKYF